MAYTTIDKPEDHFNIVTYTGNNTNNRSITGLGFQPDLTWIKMRVTQVSDHCLFDSTRGSNKKLSSNSSATEVSPTLYGGVGSFDSDGFTLVNGTTQVLSSYMFEVNKTSETYMAWNWKANGGTTSSNTSGTITTTVQANTDAGFSIVTYTGNGSTGQTIGHGLGVKPDMMIVKNRSGAYNWAVYHKDSNSSPEDYQGQLNTTNAFSLATDIFGGSAATSSVIGVKNFDETNASGSNYVAYCFAEKQGFSKIGSYEGLLGSTRPVYTGFKPAFIMIKNISAVTHWAIVDNKRAGYNDDNYRLYPNLSNAENTTDTNLDIFSNGFRLLTTDSDFNNTGSKYIYMAFAENPFVTSTGIPTTAR